jgi:hypothetical protein
VNLLFYLERKEKKMKEKKIESFVFYKNDFDNIAELSAEDRYEIIDCLLWRLFYNTEMPIKNKRNITIYKLLRDKIIGSVESYYKKNGGKHER